MNHHPCVMEQLFGQLDPELVLRTCGRTFYAASRVLPRGVRDDLALLYAFCRVVDDCADFVPDTSDQRLSPDELLDEIECGLRGQSSRSPVVSSFRSLARRRDVPLTYAHELVAGVRGDLGSVRITSEAELIRYAYRVASTVGLMMCRILGVPERGDPFAIDLGIAMQLTNIARDIAEDAGIDRVYLPEAWIRPDTLMRAAFESDGASSESGAIRQAAESVERALSLADRYYESAELGMHFLPVRVRGGIRAAAWNYRAIGSVIRKDPGAFVCRRASTSAASKAARTAGALWASVLESLPLGPSDTHNQDLHTPLAPLHVPAVGTAWA